jgi:uncharacterized membrane protein
MTRKHNLLALLLAGAVTVLALAGLSTAASKAAPVNQQEPIISGTAQEGQTLTASTGTWQSSTPLTYSYQWRRCDASGAGCSNIGGADSRTYQVRNADVGHTLRVRVTARNADGSAQSTSNETAVVKSKTAPPPPVVNGCPAGTGPIDVSQLSLPARLVIDGQTASPSTITRSTQDLTLRFHVSACNGRAVSGALVYAAAVPFNQFSIAEVPSGGDGWATLTEHRQNAFPASPRQQLLAVFVRARKPGENTLGGVSTRLLVSFPVNLRG